MGSTTVAPGLRPAYLLTVLTAVAMALVSAGGAFGAEWPYRDNPLITATFQGQDLITLFVAVPLLLAGLVLERRGSAPGRALWLGMLFYSMYGYLFYAVGAAFNAFFLLYVAGFGLPLYALLLAAPRIDFGELAPTFSSPATRVIAIGYQLAVATGLGLLWTGISISYLFTGAVPAPIVASGHPTGVVFAIDLVFIVPPMVLGAVGLIRRRAIGWVLAVVMSVSGTVYTLSLAAGSIATVRGGVGTGEELPIWVALAALGAVTAGLLLLRLRGTVTALAQVPGSRQNRIMTDEQSLQAWWSGLTAEQRERAAAIAVRPAPRGMAVDDLAATMLMAGLPTARMVWTGQPGHLVEMLDEVADFVNRVSPAP